MKEFFELSDYVDSLESRPFDIRQHLIHTVANIIAQITLGARFPHDNRDFNAASNLIGDTVRRIGELTPLKSAPCAQCFPVGKSKNTWKLVQDAVGKLANFVQPAINNHRNSDGTPKADTTADYVTSFLTEQQSQKNAEQSTFTGTYPFL